VLRQLLGALHGVNGGDDLPETVMLHQGPVAQQRMKHGQGICQTRCFHNHAEQFRASEALGQALDFQQSFPQRVGHGAAQATGVQQVNIFRHFFVKQLIETDGTEFVDDDGHVGACLRAQESIQKCGFATPQKPRQQIKSNQFGLSVATRQNSKAPDLLRLTKIFYAN